MTRLFTLLFAASVASLAAEPLGFNRDIRPILSDTCFACHGFDAKHRKAKLRLDTPEGAFAEREDAGAAIVPGKPEESLAWQRIITDDPDDIMPPEDTHKVLTPEQREKIRLWIEQGASYQKHWAFEAPVKPAASGIDHFVREALVSKGIDLSPEADRPTLIRRASMALTGLPPTIAETDAFLADMAEDVEHFIKG